MTRKRLEDTALRLWSEGGNEEVCHDWGATNDKRHERAGFTLAFHGIRGAKTTQPLGAASELRL